MPELKNFPLPDAGEGLTEAEIVNWHVGPGDAVTVNQIIVEIETAKAAVELPCPWAGVVTELLVEPGQTVQVGAPILTIDVDPHGAALPAPASNNGSAPAAAAPAGSGVPTESETADAGAAGSTMAGSGTAGSGTAGSGTEEVANLVGYGPSQSSSVNRRPRKDTPAAGAPKHDAQQQAVDMPEVSESSSDTIATEYVPLAKPPVRKLAKDLGVDLRSVTAYGEGGVITRGDVQRAASAAAPGTAPAAEPSGATEDKRERRVPIRGVRKATAHAMASSAFTAPHVTEFLTVDVTPMMELRKRLKDLPAYAGVKLTPLAFAAKAVCMAAARTPEVNASWDEENEEIVYKDYIHLGVAAATPRGLVVPKVRDADGKPLADLAAAIDDLTNDARSGTTPPADMVGGTITLTNVGVFGVDTGTPIITPGESAIFAFGAIREMPWVVDGEVVPRQVCQLALSFDHRLVDGQQGSQFLADVGALLSDPAVAMTF